MLISSNVKSFKFLRLFKLLSKFLGIAKSKINLCSAVLKSFDSKKYHLFIDIESDHLKSLNRVESHRIIMKILKNEIKEKIHGIEIKIN